MSEHPTHSQPQTPEPSGQTQDQDQEANRPIDTLRDGSLKAAIWRNEGQRGAFFTTTVARTYRDDQGQYHDTQNFRGDDLLRLGELTRKAHERTNELKREEFLRQRSEDRTQERPQERNR